MRLIARPGILSLLLAATAPTQVAEPAPIELWNGFTTASTKAELEAFKAEKPKRRVEVFPGCVAGMTYRHNGGRLVTILFAGQDNGANCFARMYADLQRDHGQPETQGTTFGGGIGFATRSAVVLVNTSSSGTLFIWRNGEKKTKLVKTPGNGYNLIFTVRPDKFIY